MDMDPNLQAHVAAALQGAPAAQAADQPGADAVPAAEAPPEDPDAEADPVPAVSIRPSFKGLLDWSKKEHMRYWEEGVKPVMEDYSMDAMSKSAFVLLTKLRAQDYQWSDPQGLGVLDIEIGRTFLPLLDHYGSIPVATLRATLIDWVTLPTRGAQDDAMIYQCIRKSLSQDALLRVFKKKELFEITTLSGVHTSGILFLKVVLDESSLTSNATVMKFKKELNNLPELFASHKWNVPKFNEAVMSVEQSLTQYGSGAPDLLHQLLPAYLECPEQKFKQYIEAKKNAHEDGTVVLTATSLMDFAQAKYLTQKDQGEWNTEADKATEKSIFALEGRIKTITRELKKAKTKKGVHKGKSPKKAKVKSPKKDDGWKFKAPRSNEAVETEIDGKEWHWCAVKTGAPPSGGCNMWTRHTPAQCKGYKYKGSEVKKTASRKKYDIKSKIEKLQAQAAAMEIDSNSSDSD